MGAGVYEGIPICPTMFSNARYKENVSFMVSLATGCVGLLIFIVAPLCKFAYGNKLEELVLFNIGLRLDGV